MTQEVECEGTRGGFQHKCGKKELEVSYIRGLILRTMADSSRALPLPTAAPGCMCLIKTHLLPNSSSMFTVTRDGL